MAWMNVASTLQSWHSKASGTSSTRLGSPSPWIDLFDGRLETSSARTHTHFNSWTHGCYMLLSSSEIFSNQLRYGMKTPATATGQNDGDDGVGE